MPVGSTVRVIRSRLAMDAAADAAARDVPRKRRVTVRVVARIGSPFTVELASEDSRVSVRAEGPVVEKARTKAVTSEDLIEHVGRMGQSPFEPVSFDVDMDEGCGMGFSSVHGVRAEACRLLEEKLLRTYAAREDATAQAPSAECVRTRLAHVRAETGIARPTPGTSVAAEACALVATPESGGRPCRGSLPRLRHGRRPCEWNLATGRDSLVGRGVPRGGPRSPGPLGAPWQTRRRG